MALPSPPRLSRIASLGAVLALCACAANPVTGRQQLILVSGAQGAEMGAQAYQDIKKEKPVLPAGNAYTQRIRAITERLIKANDLPAYDWEVNAFADDTANAFALPGGKVGVNTGLAKVARSDAQLAAVIGHEIAHAVSRHGEERVSQQMVIGTGLQLGSAALGAGAGGNAQAVALMEQAATLGIVLPYSRTHESEADEIGLFYMARAGYDPREAITLWQSMAAQGGERPPEFLSTHPSEGSRIENLQRLMPRALDLYRKAGGEG
ncbi:peptidase M48 [Rhodospirillum rubrum]|uniref:M48 family metallopeptidase n=1 Tax=Rhodospirillum rubrum TaxID=1085 RepID=UPI00190577C7|nr:M48 family metallopeptidase [Rhodospirillum rubrum]MBK1665079.1 peptidase M48 [Rhodospirillum rubrum]MBK1678308.1 peptidase M48 [Rhodospirillum rubrum]